MSKRHPGYPFGSVVQYALDPEGNPIFLISGMAQHTQNALADAHASLTVAEAVKPQDAVVAARLTLIGDVEVIEDPSAVRPIFLDKHPDATQWVDFGDFGFYRLRVRSAYYVGGFGVMGWVPIEDYAT